jgi:hypothetical protein
MVTEMSKAKMVWSGTKELKSSLVAVSKISPDSENLNFHPESSYEVLKKVIGRFGQHKPVTIYKDVVICGNGVFEACKRLGYTHVAVSTFEGTDEEARALSIADNKTKSLSYFNDDVAVAVQDLMPSFTAEELGGWGAASVSMPSLDDEDLVGFDDEEDLEERTEQKTVRLTHDQWEIVRAATQKLKEINGQAMSEGRCVELICADYLAG